MSDRIGSSISSNGPIDRKYSVVLPCDTDQFGNFIAGLLGRPQVIEGSVYKSFEVDRQNIENLYLLINQYVNSHGEAALISFNVQITYDDDSSVTLDNFNDFKNYNEIRSLISTGSVLSWIFLVRFNDKEIPERQQIDITFNMHGREGPVSRFDISPFIRQRYYPAGMTYSIRHTNRAWAAAIQALIVGQLEGFVQENSKIAKFVNSNSGWISLFFGIALFLVFSYAGLSVINELIAEKANSIIVFDQNKTKDILGVSEQVKHLSDFVISGAISKYSFYGSIYLIAAVFFSVFSATKIEERSKIYRKSFVALSKKSIELKEKYSKEVHKHWVILFGSVTTSVIVSVLSRFVFLYIVKKFDIHL